MIKQPKFLLMIIFSLFYVIDGKSQFYSVAKEREVIKVISPSDIEDLPNITKNMTMGVSVDTGSVSANRYLSLIRRINESMLLSSPLESDTLHITSHYGDRKDPISGKKRFHAGIDIRTASNNVFSMMPGRIKRIGYDNNLGNFMELEHGDYSVIYGHLFTVIGQKGDFVNAGQSIGLSGNTGRSTGEHLHIGMRYKGKRINPLPLVVYISRYSKRLRESILMDCDSLRIGTVKKP